MEALVEVNYKILEKWNRVWRIDFLKRQEAPDESTPDEGPLLRLSRALRTAGFALLAIQLYVLPLLYGLIGALAYVLRTLAVEARSLTYTKECDIHYRLRILLGALAGLVAVWLMKEPGGDETLGLFKTLSPFAVAFLVGYSVEILFAILDRFIAAFGQEKSDGSPSRDSA